MTFKLKCDKLRLLAAWSVFICGDTECINMNDSSSRFLMDQLINLLINSCCYELTKTFIG